MIKLGEKYSTHWEQNREKHGGVERIQNTEGLEEKFSVVP